MLNKISTNAYRTSAGAQYGLTSQVLGYKQTLKGFNEAVKVGRYSLRGGNGVINLAKYRLNKAIASLQIISRQKLFNNWISSFSQSNIFIQSFQTIF